MRSQRKSLPKEHWRALNSVSEKAGTIFFRPDYTNRDKSSIEHATKRRILALVLPPILRKAKIKKQYPMKNLILLALCSFSCTLFAQPVPQDWYFDDPGTYNGIGINHLYHYLDDRQPKKRVVVAILDSGVDISHEDLKDNIWVNKDEIPGNNIDDDKNGYVDDVHGWNFLGNPNGQNITKETLEITRLYAYYRNYFKDKDLTKLSKKDARLYKQYLDYQQTVEAKRTAAEKQLDDIDQNKAVIHAALDTFEAYYPQQELTEQFLTTFHPGDNDFLKIAAEIFTNAQSYGLALTTVDSLRADIDSSYKEIVQESKDDLDYRYNPDFDARKIIGDNYNNDKEYQYGNNDVRGGFAFHGTHVSGIIGAEWNDIGINGIARDVSLMSVRVVPNGDERDKDVANAIRYAVDNGANVINMSFGKGQSWDKDVVDKAVKYARKHDVLMVHGAGNDASNNDEGGNFPNDTYEHHCFLGKKTADNWIEVGAMSYTPGDNAIASFSNYGRKQVDLFAPGVQIYSTTPGNHYEYASGTSMSSPVVAGVAAMLRSYFPQLKAHEIRDILMSSVTHIDGKVTRPGDMSKVPMSELCVSGGYVNAYQAFRAAEQYVQHHGKGGSSNGHQKEEKSAKDKRA